MTSEELNLTMLQAHAEKDHAALVLLYEQAADLCEAQQDVEAACFFLTHAFIFALETGCSKSMELQTRLWRYGREVQPSLN